MRYNYTRVKLYCYLLRARQDLRQVSYPSVDISGFYCIYVYSKMQLLTIYRYVINYFHMHKRVGINIKVYNCLYIII